MLIFVWGTSTYEPDYTVITARGAMLSTQCASGYLHAVYSIPSASVRFLIGTILFSKQ